MTATLPREEPGRLRAPASQRARVAHRRLLRSDGLTAAVLVAVMAFTVVRGSDLTTTTVLNFGLFILLVASLQLMHGFTNQASLTQAGIYGIGAYVSVYVEVHAGLPPEVAFILAAVSGALVGLIFAIPLTRLREHFLALGTLAAQVLLTEAFIHLTGLTGGINGEAVPDAHLNSITVLAVILAVDLAVLVGISHLRVSRRGRQLLALRADETMASSVGVDVARLRIAVVAVSFSLAAMAGCLFTETAGYISPDDFTLITSLAVLVAVIFGGRSLTWGTLVGAAAYSALNAQTASLPGLSALILGVVLVAVLGYLPQGLTGIRLPARWARLSRTRSPSKGPDREPFGTVGSPPEADAPGPVAPGADGDD